MESPDAVAVANGRRWRFPLFLMGVLLFVAGPALYFLQVSLGHLWMPWYLPVLASLGVVLMVGSLWRRPGILRGVALVPFVLLCGLQWYAFVVATKTPDYTGPAQAGRKLPTFAAALADGSAFTSKDLENGSPTVLLFFRGRW